MKVTAEEFFHATERHPTEDELEYVNCPKAGELGHYGCGWCFKCNAPMAECLHFAKERRWEKVTR